MMSFVSLVPSYDGHALDVFQFNSVMLDPLDNLLSNSKELDI